MIQAGKLIQPVINLLRDRMLAYDVLQMDETTVQMLNEQGKTAQSKSYLWLQRGGPPDQPVVLYDYDPGRGARVPTRLLAGFKGILQTDGYDGYNAVVAANGLIHVGCMAHARRKFIAALEEEGLEVPDNPKDWMADCRHVGAGLPALKYLSKYLYRGVISDKQIIKVSDTHVTFSYTDSETKKTRQRCLLGEDFMLLLLQHVLPTGLRRARDYGFLHGNAKRLLHFVQQILRVMLPRIEPKERPRFKCPKCATPMTISNIRLACNGSG